MPHGKCRGNCLCGGVRFEAAADGEISCGMCHCSRCRRWSGGMPFTTFIAEVKLLSDKTLCWWKSSDWTERGFCGDCGSSLFWRAPDVPGAWGVSVGALENADEIKLALHICIDDKPDFYDITGDAPRETGAQHTAKVLSSLAKQFGKEFLEDALQKSRKFHGEKFAAEVERLIAEKAAG